jgi:hypothetical protein
MTNVKRKKSTVAKKRPLRHRHTSLPQEESMALEDPETSRDRRRKIILAGITMGVIVFGVFAVFFLFLGPYSPLTERSLQSHPSRSNIAATPTPDVTLQAKMLPQNKTPLDFKDQAAQVVDAEATVPPAQVVDAEATVPPVQVVDAEATVPPVQMVDEVIQDHQNHIIAKSAEIQQSQEDRQIPDAPQMWGHDHAPQSAVKNKGVEVKSQVVLTHVSSYDYNIQGGGPVLQVAAQKKILVSRDPHFKVLYLAGRSNAQGNYRISTPPPGDIYWKEEGSQKISKIIVHPPFSRAVDAKVPAKLFLTDKLQWSFQDKVSFYRVEAAGDLKFTNRVKVFSTKKQSLSAEAFGEGQWFVKISALNLTTGSWDDSPIFSVVIEDHKKLLEKKDQKHSSILEKERAAEVLRPDFTAPQSAVPPVPHFETPHEIHSKNL